MSIVTGPTLTNVNDFRAICITRQGRRSYRMSMQRRQRHAKIVATLGPASSSRT